MAAPPRPARPRVVIIGAGFGGLSTAKALADAAIDVVVIDRHNYHLFQPLLYQVATAGLSPADIASPIRGILRRQKNAAVMLAKVAGIDAGAREVIVEGGRRIAYDALVVATGARHSYFGRDEWEAHAPGIQKIDDAIYLRRRILLAFEQAETEPDPTLRRALINFVVVGGGPTGVEMAGAIAELARLIGFRNRVAVATNWAWNYATFQRGTRLITGAYPGDPLPGMAVVPAKP